MYEPRWQINDVADYVMTQIKEQDLRLPNLAQAVANKYDIETVASVTHHITALRKGSVIGTWSPAREDEPRNLEQRLKLTAQILDVLKTPTNADLIKSIQREYPQFTYPPRN